jgi:4-amino-4-deoxy-L-arabinose transferase-like glycosyltransferase
LEVSGEQKVTQEFLAASSCTPHSTLSMKTILPRLRSLRPHHWLVIALITAGAFLRLWNFVPSLMFQGDQGRDAIVVRNMLFNHDLVLIGPVTSTGNMYLGPLYYYWMAPFLRLSYPSPVGPAVAIAILSIITIGLMYVLGQEIVGKRAAFFAAILFTFCNVAITYARFSWNPNPAPLLSILLVWALYRAIHRQHWYWVLVSLCITILIQLHYVTLLTVPAAGTLWLITLWGMIQELRPQNSVPPTTTKSKKIKTAATLHAASRTVALRRFSPFLAATGLAIVVFLASLAPLVVFDIRHQFLNLKALQTFITQDKGTVTSLTSAAKIARVVKETHGRSLQIFAEQFFGQNRVFNTTLALAVIIGICYFWFVRGKEKWHSGELILVCFLLWAIVGLAFYQSTVFNHYILYLLPVTFLTYGLIGSKLWPRIWGKAIVIIFGIGFLAFNLQHLPLQSVAWQLKDMRATAQTIADRVKPGEKYNIVLLSGSGDIDGQNYRYFLETSPTPPVTLEHRGEVETLFIINEDQKGKKVTDSPIYEIVVFPTKHWPPLPGL